jgi:chemotaxis protein methyltransferase CheR
MQNRDPYQILSSLLEIHTGQTLVANRHWRVEMALKPLMRENSIPDIDTLTNILAAGEDEGLLRQCMEAMINNETCFFRDQANFALLTGPVLDSIREQRAHKKRITIWSAACSTGQEAYSLAIMINENREKWQGWDIQIIASDVSTIALNQAREGRYSQFEIQRGLPVMMMVKYFKQVGDEWIANENLRNMVKFNEHNLLNHSQYSKYFDIVLCRNMLMYLSESKRKQALDRLSDAVAPDGIIMLGAAETVIGQTERLTSSREFRGFYEPVMQLSSGNYVNRATAMNG